MNLTLDEQRISKIVYYPKGSEKELTLIFNNGILIDVISKTLVCEEKCGKKTFEDTLMKDAINSDSAKKIRDIIELDNNGVLSKIAAVDREVNPKNYDYLKTNPKEEELKMELDKWTKKINWIQSSLINDLGTLKDEDPSKQNSFKEKLKIYQECLEAKNKIEDDLFKHFG